MEAIIRELGALKEADIELKPLTIFIGENSTGKTWAAYLLSAILSSYGFKRYFIAYLKDNEHLHSYSAIDDVIGKFLVEGNSKLDIVQFFNDFGESYFNDVASLARDWMKSFMATKENPFENLSIEFKLKNKEEILEALLNYSVDESSASIDKDKGLRAVKEKGENFLYFYTEDPDIKDKMPIRSINAYITEAIFATMHISAYPGVFFFPVERTFFGSITIIKQMQDEENNFEKFKYKKRFRIKAHACVFG
jgi:hypothetical protein